MSASLHVYFLQSPAATFEKHGEHLPRGEGRFGVSRRRHNSSDGFFNNGPLRTAGGESEGSECSLRANSLKYSTELGIQQNRNIFPNCTFSKLPVRKLCYSLLLCNVLRS